MEAGFDVVTAADHLGGPGAVGRPGHGRGGDRAGAAAPLAELAQEFGGRLGVEELLDTPFMLLAPSPAAAAQELLTRATRYGITSWMTHAASTGALASVLRELR